MESKLEAYRSKKRKALEDKEKNERYWNLLTLAPLRQRVFGNANNQTAVNNADKDNRTSTSTSTSDDANGNPTFDDYDDKVEWSKLDVAIVIVKIMIWVCFLILFIKLEFAAVYLATSGFALIYLNLGNEASKTGRGEGKMSAYSVFNPGCESIDGTLTAQQFEREIRHGSGAVGN